MTRPLAIWTTGRPVPRAESARGSFFSMITRGLRQGYAGEFLDVQAEHAESYPVPREVCGIVVSGSPARIGTRDPWMLRAMDALRVAHAHGTPILGICFGHQLLGEALGGSVTPNPNGREIGTVDLEVHTQDRLLDGITAPPIVVMTHLDSIVTIAQSTTLLGSTGLDRHAALRFSETTWGVQFHPEMDEEVVGHYIEDRRAEIEAEGLNPDRILRQRRPSEYGKQLLSRFGRFCQTGRF